VPAAYLPVPQRVQTDAEAAEYVPAGQAIHSAEPV
jgi:hypothetical protein